MNIYLVLAILFVHWIADFVFQTDKEAKGKSKEFKYLISHTVTYSLIFGMFMCIYVIASTPLYSYNHNGIKLIGSFSVITLVAHTIQDHITSRINAKLYANGKIHEFFVSVGFYQFLHFAQLLITFKILTNE